MADDRTHGISLGIKAGQLVLSSQASGAGEAGEVIAANYDGDEINAACNVSFLQDFFSVVGSERARLEFNEGDSQFCLRPLTSDSFSFTYVVMPIRV
jgi:DNA polymerase III subunit beta